MSFAVSMCEDLKVKYSEEQAKRRKLHNQVEDAKGTHHNNIVFINLFGVFLSGFTNRFIEVYMNFSPNTTVIYKYHTIAY